MERMQLFLNFCFYSKLAQPTASYLQPKSSTLVDDDWQIGLLKSSISFHFVCGGVAKCSIMSYKLLI
jgi:hypothetical protein